MNKGEYDKNTLRASLKCSKLNKNAILKKNWGWEQNQNEARGKYRWSMCELCACFLVALSTCFGIT